MRKVTSAPSRAQQVFTIIRDGICNGTLEPGRHLVQEELAESLGVSRQPIQQAMLLLKAEGLVIESGLRGLYVAPLDPDRIVHHYQIRIRLDQLAARLVADRIRSSDAETHGRLETLGAQILKEGKSAQLQREAAAAVALDMKFHSLIYECSGNPLIAAAAEPHWNFLRRVMISVLLHAGRGATVWEEHETILETLLRGQADNAEDEVATHILGAQEALLASMEGHEQPI